MRYIITLLFSLVLISSCQKREITTTLENVQSDQEKIGIDIIAYASSNVEEKDFIEYNWQNPQFLHHKKIFMLLKS